MSAEETKENELNIIQSEKGFTIFLNGDIVPEVVDPIIEAIIEINISAPETEFINLIIDSPGGSAITAFKLIDVMNVSRVPVNTIGLGEIASSALCIFMCGKERIIGDLAQVMSHRATFFASDIQLKMEDFHSHISEFQNSERKIIRIYRQATQLDEQFIRDNLLPDSDVYLTAADAIEMKIATKLLSESSLDIFK